MCGNFTENTGRCLTEAYRDAVISDYVDGFFVRAQSNETRSGFEIHEIGFLLNLQYGDFLLIGFESSNVVAA